MEAMLRKDIGKDSSEEMDDIDEGVEVNKGSKYFPEIGEKFEEEIKYKDSVNYKDKHISLFKEGIAVKPLDGDDPVIYSKVESVGPYSFVDVRQDYDPECPPPTYLSYDEVNEKLPIEKEDIFEKFEF